MSDVAAEERAARRELDGAQKELEAALTARRDAEERYRAAKHVADRLRARYQEVARRVQVAERSGR